MGPYSQEIAVFKCTTVSYAAIFIMVNDHWHWSNVIGSKQPDNVEDFKNFKAKKMKHAKIYCKIRDYLHKLWSDTFLADVATQGLEFSDK